MSKKSDFKDEAKAPDAFISTSHVVIHWIERHALSIGIVIALVAASGVGYVGYSYFQNTAEAKAADALYRVEAQLKKIETEIRDEQAKKMQELAGVASAAKPNKAEAKTDFAPVVEQIKQALKEQASTRAALVTALNVTNFLIEQKQFQEALEVIEIPQVKPRTNDLLGGFWRMHYGLVLLENEKPDEAIRLYDEVLGAKELAAFHSEALLKSGIAHELKGDATKAKSIYERIGREFAQSEAAGLAIQYQRLLEIKGP